MAARASGRRLLMNIANPPSCAGPPVSGDSRRQDRSARTLRASPAWGEPAGSSASGDAPKPLARSDSERDPDRRDPAVVPRSVAMEAARADRRRDRGARRGGLGAEARPPLAAADRRRGDGRNGGSGPDAVPAGRAGADQR